jgi:hypothetical protein
MNNLAPNQFSLVGVGLLVGFGSWNVQSINSNFGGNE